MNSIHPFVHSVFRILTVTVFVGSIGAAVYFYATRFSPEAPAEASAGLEDTVRSRFSSDSISVSGKTKAESEVKLSVESSGKIESVSAVVGERVKKGQVLLTLNSEDSRADLQQAQANLDAQISRLEELKKGTREEQIGVSSAEVEAAMAKTDSARQNFIDKLYDSYTTASDVVENTADRFIKNPGSANESLIIRTSDSQLRSNILYERASITPVLKAWSEESKAIADSTDLGATGNRFKQYLVAIRSLIDKLAKAVNDLTVTSDMAQTTIDTYKSSLSAARFDINAASNSLTLARQQYDTSSAAQSVSNQQLKLQKAGNTSDAISTQTARVREATYAVQKVMAEINKSVIKAPVDGIVSFRNAEAGEITLPGIHLLSVVSQGNMEIESYVSEIYYDRLSLGTEVSIEIPAFHDAKLSGRISKIDPTAVIVDGVPHIKATVSFANNLNRAIPSGLTANLQIKLPKN